MLKHLLTLLSLLFALASYASKATQQIEYQVESTALAHPQTVLVNLPNDFTDMKSYPVIYALNTTDFYTGQFDEDFVHRIRQLERYQLTPPAVIVLINNPRWYSTLFEQADELSQFIAVELPKFIEEKYKTTTTHLFAHSYAAAYLLNQSPKLQPYFTYLHAISAVFPSVEYVQQTAKELSRLSTNKGLVTLIQENGHQSDIQILAKLIDKTGAFQEQQIPHENHQSVLPVAIAHTLRNVYHDFPAADYLNQFTLSKIELTERFKAIRIKYQQTVTEEDLQNFYSEMAQRKMELEQVEHAFTLWQEGSPRFRHYFINGWGDRYLAQDKPELARKTWQYLAKLYPHSLFAWHKLLRLAEQLEQPTWQKHARQNLQQAALTFSEQAHPLVMSFTANHSQDYPTLSVKILERVTQQTPTNKQAWKQLITLYQQQNNITLSQHAEAKFNAL